MDAHCNYRKNFNFIRYVYGRYEGVKERHSPVSSVVPEKILQRIKDVAIVVKVHHGASETILQSPSIILKCWLKFSYVNKMSFCTCGIQTAREQIPRPKQQTKATLRSWVS